MGTDNTKRIISWLGLMIVVLACFYGCSSSHQVLKYESGIKSTENLVPGIEPEESSRKILILVRGKGLEPETGTPMQKRFAAERAAILDGYRKLSERVAGMVINTRTRAGNSELSGDQVSIETRAYLQGAQIGTVSYQDGFAVVDIKLYLKPRQSKFTNGKFYY